MSRTEIITNFSNLLLLINIIIYVQYLFKNKKVLNIFAFYLLYIGLIQVYMSILFHLSIDNLFLSHYYFIGQFLVLSLFYYQILSSKLFRKIVILVLPLALILTVISLIKNPITDDQFNTLEVLITSVPILLFSVLYFIENLDKIKGYMFINSGIFLYLASSTFLFAAGNFVNDSESIFRQKYVWDINASLYAVYQILIFIEWYKNFRKKEVSA